MEGVYVSASLIAYRCTANANPLDISGVPGTGKTATVHAVIRELKRMAEANVSRPTRPHPSSVR